MLQWLKTRGETRLKAEKVYGAVVAAARRPAFYGPEGVSDTPEGRFELVALHLFLALEPLRTAGTEAEAMTQATIEAFVTDMDDCLREMGVGDLAVPKKVKRAAAAFYERAGQYRAGIADASNAKLQASFATYVFKRANGGATAQQLAAYVRTALAALSSDVRERGLDADRFLDTLDRCWREAR